MAAKKTSAPHVPAPSRAHDARPRRPAGPGAEGIHLTQAGHNGAVERLLDLSKIGAIVRKNWLVLRGDRVRLLPLVLMPLIMIVIFGYASGNLPKHLPTAIADYDRTPLSQSVAARIESMDFFSVRYHVGTQDEGRRLLDSGQIKVLFVLPAGLGEAAAAGRPAKIDLMVDESDASVAQAAKSAAQSFTLALSQSVTAQRLDALSASARSARASLSSSRPALVGAASADPAPAARSAQLISQDAASLSARSTAQLDESTRLLTNTLQFIVDPNELADSFTPAALGGATLVELATGDSQASTMQQIAFYRSLSATQTRLSSDARQLSATAQGLAAQVREQSRSSRIALSLQDAAGREIETLIDGLPLATAPLSIQVLQPYGSNRKGIDFLLPSVLALIIFQGATMNLGRAIAGERQDGSMTRVFLTPTSNVTLIFGTQVFYLLLETVRSSLIIFVAMALFGVTIAGPIPDIIFIIALFSFGATGVGMALSVIAKTQEQYMALAMLISMPMMFLSGAFFPIQTMPPILQSFAQVLPVTYAADALRGVMVKGFGLHQVLPDLGMLALFGLLTLGLSLSLFKRELV